MVKLDSRYEAPKASQELSSQAAEDVSNVKEHQHTSVVPPWRVIGVSNDPDDSQQSSNSKTSEAVLSRPSCKAYHSKHGRSLSFFVLLRKKLMTLIDICVKEIYT